jgi:hypothetical protein
VSAFSTAWAAAERSCFDYFQSVLQTIEGVHGYTPDTFPREMTVGESDFYIWTFKISGGAGELLGRNSRSEATGGSWHMDAEFMAVCAADSVAKSVGGLVIGALPVTSSDIAQIGKLYATAYPSIERTTRSLVTATSAGEERIFFELRVPMRCAFDNIVES